MKILAAVYLTVLLLSLFTNNIYASQISKIIQDECTTNSNIYYLKKFRAGQGLTLEQMKAAVLSALGKSTTNPNFATQWFKGQWFHEYTIKNIIFTGFQVRRHYLKVAVQVTPQNVTTIICDSSNLKQDEDSIHRKVPQWKKQLDTKIRIELGKASAQNEQQHWKYVRIEKSVPSDKCKYKIQEACSLPGAQCYNWYKKQATRFDANTVVITQSTKDMSASSSAAVYKGSGRAKSEVNTNLTALADYYSCPKR